MKTIKQDLGKVGTFVTVEDGYILRTENGLRYVNESALVPADGGWDFKKIKAAIVRNKLTIVGDVVVLNYYAEAHGNTIDKLLLSGARGVKRILLIGSYCEIKTTEQAVHWLEENL